MKNEFDRIHQRLALSRGGTATLAGELTWEITLPEDADADDSPTISFRNQVVIEEQQLAIHCDAPIDRLKPAQTELIKAFQGDLATAVRREGVGFDSFDAVARFLIAELDAELEEGTVEIPPAFEDGEPVFVTDVAVAREPWVGLATPFVDEVDPAWLLEQNGLLTHVKFEAFEGDVSLATAFPLAGLSGQRLLELVEDLFSFRERLLDELEGGGDEDEEEDAE
jgi:hypothetical protein